MNKSENNWFKLFALMVVGGVAKSLFAPTPAVVRPAVTKAVTDELAQKRTDTDT